MARTITGCLTCRIRRVKCDETKPSCSRCTSTGRNCDGYLNKPVQRKKSPCANTGADIKPTSGRTAMTIQPRPYSVRFVSDDQLHHFSFFHEKTISQFTEWIDTKFWSHLIPQLSLTDSLIQHGVLALSALHRNYETDLLADRETAMREYAEAMSYMRRAVAAQDVRSSKAGLQKILAAVIIFHCFENFVGNYASARVHLCSGLRLLREHSPELPNFDQPVPLRQVHTREEDDWMYDLVFALRRLDVQAETFADGAALASHNPDVLSAHEAWMVHERFESLQQAQDVIIDLLKLAFNINREGFTKAQFAESGGCDTTASGLGYIDMQRARCQAQLRQWTVPFDAYKKRMDVAQRAKASVTLALMEVYHAIGTLVITVGGLCMQHGEVVTDAFHIDFEGIVTRIASVIPTLAAFGSSCATRGQLSCDLGIVGPLFFTAIKSRDPRLRRRAIVLLKQSKRREGVWDSEAAAMVAERVLEIEEEGLFNVKTASDVPEMNRVTQVQTEAQITERKVNVWLYYRPVDCREEWEIRHETITF